MYASMLGIVQSRMPESTATFLKSLSSEMKPSEGDVSNTVYEEKYYDPNGIMIDVTAGGWPGSKKD